MIWLLIFHEGLLIHFAASYDVNMYVFMKKRTSSRNLFI